MDGTAGVRAKYLCPNNTLNGLERNGVKRVAILTTSFGGSLKAVYPSMETLRELNMFHGGHVGVDGSNYEVCTAVKSDMAVILHPETVLSDPFIASNGVSFLGSLTNDKGEISPYDSRGILQRAVSRLESLGRGNLRTAIEIEFYLRYRDPDMRAKATREYTPRPTAYHLSADQDLHQAARAEMTDMLRMLGAHIKYDHTEVGELPDGTQQQEIEFNFDDPMHTADHFALGCYIIRNVARKYNLEAILSPKPFAGIAGTGLHTHMYLERNGQSMFYKDRGNKSLHPRAYSAMAGILEHGRSLAAFTNPTVESYLRLDPNHEAPVDLFFGLANRTAAIRVPGYALNPTEANFEYRPTDASGNYYLVLAALIQGIIAGLTANADVQEKMTPEFDGVRVKLPRNLKEAIDSLRDDHAFLLQNAVFCEQVVQMQLDRLTAQLSTRELDAETPQTQIVDSIAESLIHGKGGLIGDRAGDLNIITLLGAGTPLTRARRHTDPGLTVGELADLEAAQAAAERAD